MIVVDTNVFVRYLVGPIVATDEPLVAAARSLFASVAAGQEHVTTNEAVIAEVIFVLTSSRLYGFSRQNVAEQFGAVLESPGCLFPTKERVLLALDLWAEHRRLDFVDALTALQAVQTGLPLATFDAALAALPGLALWPSEP